MKKSILILALFVASFSANAIDGQELHRYQVGWEQWQQHATFGYVSETFSFLGYVEGVFDVYDSLNYFCYPKGLEVGTVLKVVANYLNNHPERWQYSANILVRDAILQAYPCKK